ncbi:unnamed protein product [Allacma fusca]|uniref:DUF5641 domain-containing protein n=1 Tax=Allacma fusca TaxID=39272 RepID=A0A8J2JW83_9HEXA|nr:unnamed protein product [Allacma fusca]
MKVAQIESCVNSRPISPLFTDPEDLSGLTPADCLVGNCVNSFLRSSGSAGTDYLPTLQKRPKWASAEDNVKIETLLLIKDDRLPSMKWKLGHVIETHPGKDNLVRVVTLKTSDGELKRPVARLCPLLRADESGANPAFVE